MIICWPYDYDSCEIHNRHSRHSIMVYDTLLSPTIMVLRRPRQEAEVGYRPAGYRTASYSIIMYTAEASLPRASSKPNDRRCEEVNHIIILGLDTTRRRPRPCPRHASLRSSSLSLSDSLAEFKTHFRVCFDFVTNRKHSNQPQNLVERASELKA